MPKFLLVEDDAQVAAVASAWFAAAGHILEHAQSGEDALQLLGNFKYDAIILDWHLPGITGRDVCKKYRDSGGTCPIIFTTARHDIDSKEEAFDLGGDDYLVKPYDVRELAARIRSVMRRPAGLLPVEVRLGDVLLDTELHLLVVGDKQVQLRPKESALLEYLMRHPNRPSGAQALLNAVWPSEHEASADTVRTWMKYLRNKLSAVGKPDLIKTIPGSGYVIEHAVERPT
ncbi:MAG: response regulator transcription factor [Candidatus Obscuribacterales bacterium]